MASPSPIAPDRSQLASFDALGSPVWRLVHPLTTGSDSLGVSIVLVAPGERVLRHRHNYEEAYTVTAGTGLMYLEGHPELIRLRPGMSVYVAAGRIHGQLNDGDEDLAIICSLAPPPVVGELPDMVETVDAPASYRSVS